MIFRNHARRSERLTTLGIYTHVIDASHRKAVEALEARWFGEMDCLD